MKISAIKKSGKSILSEKWAFAIGAFGLYLALVLLIVYLQQIISSVAGMYFGENDVADAVFSVVFGIAAFVIVTPVYVGACRWFYKNAGNGAEGRDILYFFDSKFFFKSILLELSIAVRKILWVALYTAVWFAGLAAFSIAEEKLPANARILGFTILAVLAVFLVFAYALTVQRYTAAEFIYGENPSIGVRGAIRESENIMKCNGWLSLKFKLSFIPWLLLCLLALPIIYVVPYYWSSSAVFVRSLSKKACSE